MKIIFRAFDIDGPIDKKKKVDYFNLFPSRFLDDFFSTKSYGKDVEEIEIAAILVKMLPGYEDWHRPKRPKYYDYYFSQLIPMNPPVIFNKRFVIQIRFSNEVYDRYLKSTGDESDAIIAQEFYRALDILDKLPKRLKDFDKEGFKKDVETLFRSHGWL